MQGNSNHIRGCGPDQERSAKHDLFVSGRISLNRCSEQDKENFYTNGFIIDCYKRFINFALIIAFGLLNSVGSSQFMFLC